MDVDKACSKLEQYAKFLEEVMQDIVIQARATRSASTRRRVTSIGGGLLALGGLIAAPFTGGASLAATVMGVAVGASLGTGVASHGEGILLSDSMEKHGWDKIKIKRGKGTTKCVCKQARILSECLIHYCKTMMEFCHLSTREKDQIIAKFRGHDVEMLKLAGDTNFRSHLKELSDVGEKLQVGFGIWNVADPGPEEITYDKAKVIARQFREFAVDLKKTRETICSIYDTLVCKTH